MFIISAALQYGVPGLTFVRPYQLRFRIVQNNTDMDAKLLKFSTKYLQQGYFFHSKCNFNLKFMYIFITYICFYKFPQFSQEEKSSASLL